MTVFLDKLANEVMSSDGYSDASSVLFDSYVVGLVGKVERVSRGEVKRLITAAQIFYKAEGKGFRREGAVLLSMLLDLCANDYPDLIPIAHSVFSNAGDFPNIKLLSDRYPEVPFRNNFFSEAQMEFREELNTVEELDFPLTDYQRALWNDLSTDKDVITAAPTSAGKTHIILNYLLNSVAEGDGAFAAVVVPTRALISEVASKVYELAKALGHEDEIEICTIPKDGGFGAKTFFVMTQERLYEIILRGDIEFNYLFIDEAHNITDKSRGVLLHITIEKILENSNPQIIISMPSSNYQDSFSTIFKGIDFKKEVTKNSPVAKVIMSVTPKGRNLVVSRHGSTNEKVMEKGFGGRKLADIVYKLGVGQGNIIYRNQTNHCEDLADEISKLVVGHESSELLEEAADYVEKFIHTDFSLARNLRKGVAFHYGPLPSSIRVMIENLAKDDRIKYIACTSTLAEGVNLPAKNLFLKNPLQPVMHQASERIEDVKINNITGRAGRMLKHFSGNVFLVEPDKWTFKDYFDEESSDEDKVPTYFKTLNEELDLIIRALVGEYTPEEGDQYRIYTIANKLIKEFSSDELEKTLAAEELTLDEGDLASLKRSVQSAHESLKVSSFTLEANPTVGYIQQNKLFGFLDSQDELDSWALPHPKANDLYERLLTVCERLHEFGVYMPSESYTLEYICVITRKWIQGNSLKDIISEQIEWEIRSANERGKPSASINSSVRNVIKVVNNDIRFRLSNALRCYQALLSNILISRGVEISNVKLHSFIEIGACDERMINLINMGLSREAAKEIDDNLTKNEQIESPKNLLDLHRRGGLRGIHTITEKELLGLLG